ncbi:MucR family transcriptional regulator [uncultured Brevundimonas sp.]|uniref:MucR family transcriptional regulator n=1 Tax=uncultured Brevundimonas sp. TaxID=213418 RepID=UPI0030EE89FF|tara:strand:- start:73 stop:534 length:462 start_codon:yes stop_codon:yes gene_type:complete
MTDLTDRLLDMTVGIVANYVSSNRLNADEIGGFIKSVHQSLATAGTAIVEDKAAKTLRDAEVRKLITPQGIRSLIDGRTFKSLRRHIGAHGYTPESYREAFGLPVDFPMVAAVYSAERSASAKAMGLGAGGRQGKKAKVQQKPKLKRRQARER